MSRGADGAGFLGIVLGAVRSHRVETALVVVSALAWTVALVWANDPTVSMAVTPGGEATDVDARLASALLELRDGQWAAREVEVEPTLGRSVIEVSHVSAAAHLFPWPAAPVWSPGGPLLRRRVPDWSVRCRYRIYREDGEPAMAIDEVAAYTGGWREMFGFGRAVIGCPLIASGFHPWGRAFGSEEPGGRALHVAALLPVGAGEPSDVATWRALVEHQAARLAAASRADRDSAARVAWWRSERDTVIGQAALAAMLRVPGARPALLDLRADLDRDLTTLNPGNRFAPDTVRAMLDACVALLAPEPAPTADDIVVLLRHFAGSAETLDRLEAVYADAPAVRETIAEMRRPTSIWRTARERRPWSAPLTPPRAGFAIPLWLLLVVVAAAWGGGATLRRRDALAFGAAAAAASGFVEILPHVTLQSPGLMALAIVVARLRRRGAVRVPPGVVHGLAVAALLLPLGSVTRLPLVDALGRASACVAMAWLAVGALDPHVRPGDAPRRPLRKREIAWTAVQLLAVTGCVLALLLALLDPASWAQRAPRPRWVAMSAGLVLALGAGVIAFLRRRDRRPQPAVTCALALAAAAHVTVLLLSPFPRDWLSGEKEVGAIGAIGAGVVTLFAAGRLFAVARAHRAAS